MSRLAYVLTGVWIGAFATGSALAGSASSRLTVTVTVVAPGTLGGTSRPPGDSSGEPDAIAPTQERPAAPTPRPETASPTR